MCSNGVIWCDMQNSRCFHMFSWCFLHPTSSNNMKQRHLNISELFPEDSSGASAGVAATKAASGALPAGKEYKDRILLNLNDSKIKTRNDERCSKMFQMAAFCDILRHSPGQDVKFRHPKDLANGAACCHAGSNIFKTIMSYQNIST